MGPGQALEGLADERLKVLDLLDPHPDLAKLGGWFLRSLVVVGSLLGWGWRFRNEFWHRNNTLLLLGVFDEALQVVVGQRAQIR